MRYVDISSNNLFNSLNKNIIAYLKYAISNSRSIVKYI